MELWYFWERIVDKTVKVNATKKIESINDIWIPYISSIGSWSQLPGSIKFKSWDKDWVERVFAKEIVLNVDKDLSVVVHCNCIYNKEQLEAMSNNSSP